MVGMDEVGRGCLAGPLTVAAVVLPPTYSGGGIRDSKWLTSKQRMLLAGQIRKDAVAIGVGWASPGEIDENGLTRALGLAGGRALAGVPSDAAIILDGNHNYLDDAYAVTMQVKADESCLAAAAASIIAKVARDRYMELLHRLHPSYGFSTNRGYGSVTHLATLLAQGPSPFHRRSFNPLKASLLVG